MSTDSIEFETGDGVILHGDLAVVDDAWAGAIICHPHPQYGGNRFNNVVDALFSAFPEIGITTLRFDFREEFGLGVAELGDAAAAIDVVAATTPGVPIIAAGYSFGAMVALGLDDTRIERRVLVAPPLGRMEIRIGSSAPTLVLTPAHDQFGPPDVVEPIVAGWTAATFEVVPSADHSIIGRAGFVAERASEWLSRSLPRSRASRRR